MSYHGRFSGVVLAQRMRNQRDLSSCPCSIYRRRSAKNVDNMTQNRIIADGQATLSGSGTDGTVGRHSNPSGVTFAFTNRFVALVTRVRNTVDPPISIVTNLPKTRRNHAVSNCSARTLELLEAAGAVLYLRFSRIFTLSQSAPRFMGRSQANY